MATDYSAIGEKIKILGREFPVYQFDEIRDKHFGFIYVTVNDLTGKMYVGLHYRWVPTYLGSGVYFMNALNKYGKDSFTRHIIDVADSYEELIELEADYIRNRFGVDCAESSLFYNITSGLQRGGDTWRGMTEEDRVERSRKAGASIKRAWALMTAEEREERSEANRQALLKAHREDPTIRDRVSEGTRKGMTPEVRAYLSEIKTGFTPKISDEERQRRAERMREVGKMKTTPWNKGVSTKDTVGKKVSLAQRKYYDVYLRDKRILTQVTNKGGYQAIADHISEYFGGKAIGKNNVSSIIKSGSEYVAKIPKKEFMNGLRILQVEGNEKRTHDRP